MRTRRVLVITAALSAAVTAAVVAFSDSSPSSPNAANAVARTPVGSPESIAVHRAEQPVALRRDVDVTPGASVVATDIRDVPIDSEATLIARHLQPAPREMQQQALAVMQLQLEHHEAQAQAHRNSPDPTLASYLHELAARFQVELRSSAIRQLEAGDGLLVVTGRDYKMATHGLHHIRWTAGESMFGMGLEVLCTAHGNQDLLLIEEEYRAIRDQVAMDFCLEFNLRPIAERKQAIETYRTSGALPGLNPATLELIAGRLALDRAHFGLELRRAG